MRAGPDRARRFPGAAASCVPRRRAAVGRGGRGFRSELPLSGVRARSSPLSLPWPCLRAQARGGHGAALGASGFEASSYNCSRSLWAPRRSSGARVQLRARLSQHAVIRACHGRKKLVRLFVFLQSLSDVLLALKLGDILGCFFFFLFPLFKTKI